MSIQVRTIVTYMEQLAPNHLAAEWDNVGLLVGDLGASVERVITCLTVTPAVVSEAIQKKAHLILTHHPMLFKPTKRIVAHHSDGQMLLQLIRAGIAVFSAHTAFDNTKNGINDQIAALLELSKVQPLRLDPTQKIPLGEARIGTLTTPRDLKSCADTLKQALSCRQLQMVGSQTKSIARVAVACGAGGEFLGEAIRQRADLFVTGEMRFHDLLRAEAADVAVCLPGHYATERFAMERLAKKVAAEIGGVEVWASEAERDPVQILS